MLKGITLQVNAGEMVAVMGASGSGKSTLLHIIGLLDQPSSGVYRLEGREVHRLSRKERAYVRNQKIGFVFQQFNLLPRATVLQNVELPLLYAGVPATRRRERAFFLLERMGLKDFAHHRPVQLSGGQQQRVAIARALVNQPVLLLADEPTGQLDSRTGLEVMALFQELHQEMGVTIILVTHDQTISRFCQRIVYLQDGLIRGEGKVTEPRRAKEELAATQRSGEE
ncbi:ABC transporter ATP-binding protein [Ammonifex thiophilus]|uniref:ABC transporter ATP-binding protein n=1 Tax=Ammonifex thiophilus TaxID=444093 RepID=UPI0026C14558